jgi:uncharacterized protein (TIGR00255 family)
MKKGITLRSQWEFGEASECRRGLMRGMGYSEEELKRPLIGIVNSWNEYNPGHVHLDKLAERVKQGVREAIDRIAESLGLINDISLASLVRFPEILCVEKKEEDSEAVWPILENAVNKAMDTLISMRETEGRKLLKNLLEICDRIEEFREKILARAPQVVLDYKEKLSERIRELVDNNAVDEMRLAMEVAIFADKCDINEELVRLKSHVEQFRETFKSEGPVGRKLDFLVQEMNREVNTIGSKANDLEITKNVVELKTEIEKAREQIQNIE